MDEGARILGVPVLVRNPRGEPWVVGVVAEEGTRVCATGRVCARRLEGAESVARIPGDAWTPIFPEPGDYDRLRAVFDGSGNLWVVVSEHREGVSRILAGCLRTDRSATRVPCTGWGHVANPSILPADERVRVVWERHAAEGSFLEGTDLSLPVSAQDVQAPGGRILTPAGARFYRPQIAADDEGVLYVAAEAYDGERYRLVALALDPCDGTVLSSAGVGFDERNDLEPSLCSAGDGILAAWENSRPVRAGDRMIGTIIPAFGHGWRVESRMGLRRIRFRRGEWFLDDADPGDSSAVLPGASGSSGAPRVTVDAEGRPFVAWLSWNRDPRGWRIRAAFSRSGGDWEEISLPDLFLPRRVAPPVCPGPEPGSLLLAGLTESGAKDRERFAVVRATVPEGRAAAWIPAAARPARPPDSFRLKPSDRPVVRCGDRVYRLYWGDLHMHSNLSPCSLHEKFHCTEIEEKYRVARDVGGLDFAMVTDHDFMSDPAWARTRRSARLFDLPGGFAAFLGFEWTASMRSDGRNHGHYCVLYADEDGPLLRVDDPETGDPEGLWRSLPRGRSLTIPHHPSDAMHPLNWDFFDPAYVRLAEIFQVRGSCEFDGCDLAPENFGRETVPGRSIQDGLARGYRFGFTGGGEHEGVGVTAVLAEELTRESIFEALWNRRVYATTGARFLVDFRVDGRMMGAEYRPGGAPTVSVEIRADVPVREVRIVRAGRVVRRWARPGEPVRLEWTDREVSPGDLVAAGAYYYAVVVLEDGAMGWTSPVFLVADPESPPVRRSPR